MMGMGFGLSMVTLCPVCDTNAGCSEDHNPACPRAKMAKAVEEMVEYKCAKCDGFVRDTTDDYLECRKCGTTYSIGLAQLSTDEAYLHRVRPTETYQKAWILPGKGDGKKFRIDLVRKRLKAEERQWRRRK